ncbi:MAG: septum formation protein Maf, partial [Oscillospiraceae bacterium]|nr:septum formation protein Maf [Oscillospiraceae bacterium]
KALCAGLSDPETIVRTLARAKASHVAAHHAPDDLVIGADTVVAADAILGKPKDRAEAFSMLSALSGRAHRVYSGVAVTRGGQIHVDCDVTEVRFRALRDAEIYAYIDRARPYDKAGAYGIQEQACLFISGITGDYYGVMGLPLFKLGILLEKAGLTLL